MSPKSELILYQTEDHRTRIEVRLENETVWLTQAQLSDLFQRERSVITKHIRNIFEEGELGEKAVCANYAQTAADGKTYQTVYYNLDVIIAVGYRVKSQRGTQFAKNYLTREELKKLSLIVTQYLDFAELQALERRPMTMRDWIADVLVNAFIRLHPIPAVVKLPSSLSYDATSWRGKSAGQSVFVSLQRDKGEL